FAGTVAWALGRALQRSWLQLADHTFVAVRAVLSVIYSDVVADPVRRLVGTRSFRVVVAPQCSGIEGIGLAAILIPLFLCLFRDRLVFPRALLIFPAGILT